MKEAYFAAGSFWNAQLSFDTVHGVLATYVGYMGGIVADPSYMEVLYGGTGHVQTVKVVYDEKVVSYADLVDFFFEIHNPSILKRSSNKALNSVLFYSDANEKKIAQKAKALFNIYNRYHKPALTQIRKAGTFYMAEEAHQHFIEKSWPLFN